MRARSSRPRSGERGATAIIVAIVLAVLCGFAALSLDVGHLFSVRGELQNGADAAALAGAKRLTGRNVNFELPGAKADAANYARNHPTDRWDVEPTTVQLGAWLSPARGCGEVGGTQAGATGADGYKFCAIPGTSEADAANINAVRVVTQRTGAPGGTGGGAVALAFGGFVGKREQAVGAEAIAVSGGPASDACPEMPLAIRAGCLYDGGEIRCDDSGRGPLYYVGLNPAPTDSAGLTSLSTDPANGKAACEILRTQDGCTPIETGTEIEIQNGMDWSAACDFGCPYKTYTGNGSPSKNDTVCEVLRKRADPECTGSVKLGADGRPAYRTQVPVVLYEGEDLATCDGQYNQQARIVGMATVAVVSVRCEGPHQLPFGEQPITAICDQFTGFSGDRCVAIQLYCDEEEEEVTRVGGGWFGTSPLQPVLVR